MEEHSRKKINEETILELKKLTLDGYSVNEISQILNICCTTVRNYITKFGLTIIPKNTREEEILKLHSESKTVKEISQLLNMSQTTVRKYLKENNLDYNRKNLKVSNELLENIKKLNFGLWMMVLIKVCLLQIRFRTRNIF
jgi:DNA-binding CsgD family transcriptional regulator